MIFTIDDVVSVLENSNGTMTVVTKDKSIQIVPRSEGLEILKRVKERDRRMNNFLQLPTQEEMKKYRLN